MQTRREFSAASLGLLSATLATGCDDELAAPDDTSAGGSSDDSSSAAVFRHGVASGDPLTDGVILWTRISGASDAVDVAWSVALDETFEQVVACGSALTDETRDFTVKVDVTGLEPGTAYYYAFTARGETSPTGRTKTLPDGDVTRVRLAVCSCSNLPAGFFNAYRLIADHDVDVVLHLGDYLYEYANGTFGDGSDIDRIPEPNREIVSLEDYRARHAQYKTDPDLQAAHRRHPWIAVWDDHESANDSSRSGAENHQPQCPPEGIPGSCTADEGDWNVRREASIQAYLEWMPVREQADADRIYRAFAFGDLFDLLMLDTRLVGRDPKPADGSDFEDLAAPDRELLGPEQEAWLFDQLEASMARGARWRVLGQQVMLAHLQDTTGLVAGVPAYINTDQWDGYQAARERLFAFIESSPIDDLVVLTGDLHSSWASELANDPYDPQVYDPETSAGSLGVEFVVSAVTSEIGEDLIPAPALAETLVRNTQPHNRYVDLQHKGYLLLDITADLVEASFYNLATVREPSLEQELAAVWRCQRGTARLQPGDT